MTAYADVDALVEAALAEFDRFDIMVNNAGITRDATLRKMTEEDFDQVISTSSPALMAKMMPDLPAEYAEK